MYSSDVCLTKPSALKRGIWCNDIVSAQWRLTSLNIKPITNPLKFSKNVDIMFQYTVYLNSWSINGYEIRIVEIAESGRDSGNTITRMDIFGVPEEKWEGGLGRVRFTIALDSGGCAPAIYDGRRQSTNVCERERHRPLCISPCHKRTCIIYVRVCLLGLNLGRWSLPDRMLREIKYHRDRRSLTGINLIVRWPVRYFSFLLLPFLFGYIYFGREHLLPTMGHVAQ